MYTDSPHHDRDAQCCTLCVRASDISRHKHAKISSLGNHAYYHPYLQPQLWRIPFLARLLLWTTWVISFTLMILLLNLLKASDPISPVLIVAYLCALITPVVLHRPLRLLLGFFNKLTGGYLFFCFKPFVFLPYLLPSVSILIPLTYFQHQKLGLEQYQC